VRLKYPLRNIKPYRASLAHGRLHLVVTQHHYLGTSMPSGGVHTIKVASSIITVVQTSSGIAAPNGYL
jgi:hypothetical protein